MATLERAAATNIETTPTACSACGADSSVVVGTGRDYIYHGSDDEFQHVQCTECGHIYLNPQPTIESLPRMYPANYGTFSNRFRGRVSLLGRIKTRVNLRRLKQALAALPRGARVLDVGCGNGELLIALRERRKDLVLFGLDWHFPPETRRNLEDSGIACIESPLEAAELPTEKFDLIVMLQLIEHLWQPEAGVRRLAESLAPGGRLLIETPNTDGWDRKWFASGTWGGYYFPRHLNLYNFERLAELLERSGLAIAAQRNLPAPLIWSYSLQAVVQKRFGRNSRLVGLVGVKNLPLIAAFMVFDLAAMAIGLTTSNQQTIAVNR